MDLEAQKVERPTDLASAIAQAINIPLKVAVARMRKIEASKDLLKAWRTVLLELGPFTLITNVEKTDKGEITVSVAPSTSGAPRAPNMSEKSYQRQVEYARQEMRRNVGKFELSTVFRPVTGLGGGVVPIPNEVGTYEPDEVP